jgi:PhnB protein
MAVNPIPDGFHSLTPHIVVDDTAKAIDFYQEAFGAKEWTRAPGPGGKILYALIQIGDSMLMLNDEFPEMGGPMSPKTTGSCPVMLTLYVPDVDHTFAQAVAAGAKASMPVADQFWGDRYGMLTDPFGHRWAIATHKEDLTQAQITARQATHFGAKAK